MMTHPEGGVLAGSDGQGRIYRVDSSGVAEVVLDSPHREIADLALDEEGTLWAVAVAHRPLVSERPRVKVRVPEGYLIVGPYRTTRPALLVIDAYGRRVDSIRLSAANAADVAKRLRAALETPAIEHWEFTTDGTNWS